MIVLNLVMFLLFFFILIKASDYAIRFSSRIARIMRFQEFVVSFFIVAFISILPEGTISVISAFRGESDFGMATLIGSNVADLSIVFGLVALFSLKGVKVRSKIIRDNFIYLILLLFPFLLGIDGAFSRTDGVILLVLGILFYVKLYRESKRFSKEFKNKERHSLILSIIFLILSMAVILVSAYLTINYATEFAEEIGVPSIFIGLTLVSLGTCMPELIFSLRAVRKNHDGLALGDLLGTVITDATIIFGIVALINPFIINPIVIWTVGGAMFLAGVFVFAFMKTGRILSKTEGIFLILFYVIYLFVEFLLSKIV